MNFLFKIAFSSLLIFWSALAVGQKNRAELATSEKFKDGLYNQVNSTIETLAEGNDNSWHTGGKITVEVASMFFGVGFIKKGADAAKDVVSKNIDDIAEEVEERAVNLLENLWQLSKQKLGKIASGTTLGENMTAVGRARPPNSHAHHITAGGASNLDAQRAKQILQNEGIDINEAANGVFLPSSSKYAIDNAVPHANVHTNVYYKEVYDRLKVAQPGKVRDELQKIADELLNGTFPN